MQSILSLLSGVVLIGLVYGLSFLPTATLARCDDIGFSDDDGGSADADTEALPETRRDPD
jgi:hypothetical protein